jgi:hypothetical protein
MKYELMQIENNHHQLTELDGWDRVKRVVAKIDADPSDAKVLSAAFDFLTLAKELTSVLAEDAERNSTGARLTGPAYTIRERKLSLMRLRMKRAIARCEGDICWRSIGQLEHFHAAMSQSELDKAVDEIVKEEENK